MSPRRRAGLLCGWCAWGNHKMCAGTIEKKNENDVLILETHCICHDADHDPDEDLADRMARYRRPDLSRDGGVLLDELVQTILQDHVQAEEITIDTLKAMTLAELKAWAADYEVSVPAGLTKAQAVKHVWEAL